MDDSEAQEPASVVAVGMSPEAALEGWVCKEYGRRRFRRWQIEEPGVVQHSGTRAPCRVRDISPDGACIEFAGSENLGIGDQVSVRYVHPDSPAAEAGIQAEDRLLAINDKPVGQRSTEETWKLIAEFFQSSDSKISFFKPPPPLPVRVLRQGQELDFTVPAIKACALSMVLVFSNAVNAFADGNHIILTTSMLRFTQTDEELAMVIGHELAHNTLGHIEKTKMNAAPGQILDDLIFQGLPIDLFGNLMAQAFSQEFELEADYTGLYFTARGGYDITEAAQFWRRMAMEYPGSIGDSYLSSHPSSPERVIALEEGAKEIAEKRRQGRVLTPELMDFKKVPIKEEPASEEEP